MQNSLEVGPLKLTFHRTCRVPELSPLGKPNALPLSLGTFPILKASALGDRRPEEFHPESYLIPIWTREALWISFAVAGDPIAVSIGAGKINAVTGKILDARLVNDADHPQSYLVAPPQPWIDGFKTADGTVRQFVAVKLGSGETVEGQLTGKEEIGGLQFGVHLPKLDLLTVSPPRAHRSYEDDDELVGMMLPLGPGPVLRGNSRDRAMSTASTRMGLGAGGQIVQKIYEDPYVKFSGKRADEIWNEMAGFKSFVHLVHGSDWEALTGQKAPPTPVTYAAYQKAGIPWVTLYDADYTDVQASAELSVVVPVSGEPSAHFEEKPSTPDEKTENLW